MRTLTTSVIFLFIFLLPAFAQPELAPVGGGSYTLHSDSKDEISPLQRAQIISDLKANEQQLRQAGKIVDALRPMATLFHWPLAQSDGFYDKGYYGISNYVDQNLAYPNQLKDYNCGTRTYDLASGYNHKGTDIFLWPFPWQKMQLNQVKVIAAAPGILLAKHDGNSDQNCAFCTTACQWNAVYVMHADNSVAWYGHLKKNSLTTKAVGETVVTGEFLGIVGSSGNSTGPHLHFEIYTNNTYTQLVDPWQGPCNAMNNEGWWANQQPYEVPTLLSIMTHSAPPAMTDCPAGENPNTAINFASGSRVYLGTYYRDQQAGKQAIHQIFYPNGSVYFSFTHNLTQNFSASYWYHTLNLPANAPKGMWRYQVSYDGKPPLTTWFAVNTTAYVFTGNGQWNDPNNWLYRMVPPATLPAGHEIMVDPIEGGAGIVNQLQLISAGGKVTIAAGKRLSNQGNLIIQ